MNRTAITFVLFATLVSFPAAAATWNVPATVPTIAGAAALAADGDTILVACGTYLEHDIAIRNRHG
ncbi:hypothetical protein K8I85_06070, partial [bacterium]|nr:hypothetical protein [bacterium]